MLKTVFLGACGKKAVFLVTPKQSQKYSVKEMFRYSWDSVVFAVLVGVLAFFACGSILPVIFIVAGCLLAPLIIFLSNFRLPENRAARKKVKAGTQDDAAPLPLRRASRRSKALPLSLDV